MNEEAMKKMRTDHSQNFKVWVLEFRVKGLIFLREELSWRRAGRTIFHAELASKRISSRPSDQIAVVS